MKLRIIEVEGTPEELAPYVPDVLGNGRATAVVNGEPRQGTSVPSDIAEWLDSRVGNGRARPLYDRLVTDILALGPDVRATLGSSGKTADTRSNYVMFHRTGSGVGAFAYVSPKRGGSTWRLRKVPKDARFAIERRVKLDSKYRVVCGLRSEEAFQEALWLAQLAYEETVA